MFGQLSVAIVLSGCYSLHPAPPWVAAVAGDGPGNPNLVDEARVDVKNLPKSKRGNPAQYTVFGQTYRVMDSALGYTEQGMASWYGKKFHGRETSSGEVYDMHSMTAAHRYLPLPTFAKVTRLDNGKSIVVKINDRGPFVHDRIIDLSYAAAKHLDMVNQGTAPVYVEALSSHHVETTAPIEQIAKAREAWQPLPPAVRITASQVTAPQARFIQVGAFSEAPNAERLRERIQATLNKTVAIEVDPSQQLHLVRVGPFPDDIRAHDTLQQLRSMGIDGYTVMR